jgi:hypothetical protein
MAFTFTGLTSYTDQERLPLITKAVFSARSAALFTKQVGIKFAAALNLMDTDALIQSGDACGYTTSGTTAFTQRNITVGRMKVQETLCPRSLEQYWMQTQLTAGSTYDGVPFEQAFSEQKALRIAEALETAIWQGNAYFSGVNQLLNAASATVVLANASSTTWNPVSASVGITATNIIGIFDKVYNDIPQAILTKQDLVIFCGWNNYRTLVQAFKQGTTTGGLAVLYNQVDLASLANGEFVYPGTNVRVIAVPGLTNTNRIVCTYLGNLFYGTDLLSDEEQFSIWFSKDNDEVRFQAAFKAGVQIAYPEFVVDFKLA